MKTIQIIEKRIDELEQYMKNDAWHVRSVYYKRLIENTLELNLQLFTRLVNVDNRIIQ